MSEVDPQGTQPTTEERTDAELAAKLRGQLEAVAQSLTELGRREYDIEVRLVSNDSGTWTHRITLSKTVYL